MYGIPYVLKNPPCFETCFVEPKAKDFEKERAALVQEGLNASDDAPGADRQTCQQEDFKTGSSELFGIMMDFESPRSSLAGSIMTEHIINDDIFLRGDAYVRSTIPPHGDGMHCHQSRVYDESYCKAGVARIGNIVLGCYCQV